MTSLDVEVFDMFLAYKALVEKHCGHQLPKLRTNNGCEYVNNNITSYCTTQGIQMQQTVPYTPQQNGVVERKNHTLRHQIQRLRTDNGGKYVNDKFTSYCTAHAIQMKHIVPYTP